MIINKTNKLSQRLDQIAPLWKKYYGRNRYYHKDLEHLAQLLIPCDASVLEFGCRCGELLATLPNKKRVGIENSQQIIQAAEKGHKKIEFRYCSYEDFPLAKKYDYILLSNTLALTNDVQNLAKKLQKISHDRTRIIAVYYNFLWKPLWDIAEKLRLRLPQPQEPNWLSSNDVINLFALEGFEDVKSGQRFLIPYNIPLFSHIINKYVAKIPPFHLLCLTNYIVFRKTPRPNNYSLSLIVPARNEAGNIPNLLSKIPIMTDNTEVIFVEGHSKDDTYKSIKKEIARYKGPLNPILYKQKGKGKKDAVAFGYTKAKNNIVMILDADLSVDPSELPKFYNALASGYTDLAMGSRLVYPMEKQAMRTLNYFGNKFFSIAFTFLLGRKIRDTLCGTKAIFKKDLDTIRKYNYFGDFDPFGDYDLIFGSAKLNLKITEIPIHYKERVYGTSNISRFEHGALLMKMIFVAARKLTFV